MPELFRKKAIDRLRSPERIDEVLAVLHRRDWIPLAILCGLCACALLWMVLGSIPVTVDGNGVILTPSTIVPFHTPCGGQLASWRVAVGDHVEKGQLLATLNQPELEGELTQARARLQELQTRNVELNEIADRWIELERQALTRKREFLQHHIETLTGEIAENTTLVEAIRTKGLAYIAEQRENTEQARATAASLGDRLAERLASYQNLRQEGLTSEDIVLNAQRSDIENQLRLADLELKLRELELSEIRAEQSYLESRGRISDSTNLLTELTLRLRELDITEAQLEHQSSETTHSRRLEVRDLERRVKSLQEQLALSREIRSEYTGRILELTATTGSILGAGFRLGTIDARTEDRELVVMAYFPVATGKRIQPDMRVRVAPATVERERHGSAIGVVRRVSGYSVTPESVASTVGNRELARALTAGGGQIEVRIELQKDPTTVSGYEWTSVQGPPLRITAGTTAIVTVTIEERVPISFVIPILRNWTGL